MKGKNEWNERKERKERKERNERKERPTPPHRIASTRRSGIFGDCSFLKCIRTPYKRVICFSIASLLTTFFPMGPHGFSLEANGLN